MVAINRSSGRTRSEKYLAQLADSSFLDLWSYPNLFIDRRSSGPKSDGKELCDLLVVCGDHVLIFSDKSISWPAGDNVDLSWSRWFRRAVKKSADQVRGAARWIDAHADRLFLDAACTSPFPIELPPLHTRKVHGIVVALGAADACRQFRGSGSGSLQIIPTVCGGAHVDSGVSEYEPFTVGDVAPDGPFVHVMDDVTLDVLLRELDTVTDFAEYLDRKADFIRSGHLDIAEGEEDLLAYYLVHGDDYAHGFVRDDGNAFSEGQSLRILKGSYASLRTHPKYIAKKKADEPSYVWDELIKAFTKNIIGGTLVEIAEWGGNPQSREHELGVRYMALESRVHRRILGEAIFNAMERVGDQRRFARGMVPQAGDPRKVGYVFLLLRVPDASEKQLTYAEYRELRSSTLYGYVINTLRQNPYLERVIGIATEPPVQYTGRKGSSEDLLYMEMPEWSEDLVQEAQRFKDHYGIFGDTTLTQYRVHVDEYPDVEELDHSFTNPIPYTYHEDDLVLLQKHKWRRKSAGYKASLLSGTAL